MSVEEHTKFVGIVGIFTAVMGVVTLIFGVFVALDLLKSLNFIPGAAKFSNTLNSIPFIGSNTILLGLLIGIIGIILCIIGIGLYKTMQFAWLIAVPGLIVGIVLTLIVFRTNILQKIGITFFSILLGALLAESEYYKGNKPDTEVKVTVLIKLTSLGSIIGGIIITLLGVGITVDSFLENIDLKLSSLILEQGQESSLLPNDPLIIGIIALVIGILLAVSGYGLYKVLPWGYYLYIVFFILGMLGVLLFSPFSISFIVPTGLVALMGFVLGAIWAESEYFEFT